MLNSRLYTVLRAEREQKRKEKIRMKMSKFRIAVLVLLAVTVVYAVMLASNLWSYCQIPTEGYDPILGHWYGNPKPV